jgi:two-component system OmpR family sensor kinase
VADDQHRRLETLQSLLELPAADLKTALMHCTDRIADALRADKVDAFLYEPERDALVAVGSSSQPLSALQRKHGLDVMPIANGGRAVWVYQTGKTFVSGRADEDPEELRGIKETLRVRSNLAVPLDVNAKRRGVILVASLKHDHFDEADLRFAESVARWVAAVVHRATLVEEIARNSVAQGRRAAAEELITVFAHDMRNHITPVMARLQLLQRRAQEDQSESAVRELDLALRSLRRVATMVTDILDVARIDRGVFDLQTQPVDMVPLIEDVAETLSTPEHPVLVRVKAEGAVVAAADPQKARQCVENLLSNAVKHSPANAPVTVVVTRETEERREVARIHVIDEGPGVAPELLPRLFDRFVTSGTQGGVGLGLYLAKRIAQAHGGDLSVDSTPGKGARFTLALPIYENRAA